MRYCLSKIFYSYILTLRTVLKCTQMRARVEKVDVLGWNKSCVCVLLVTSVWCMFELWVGSVPTSDSYPSAPRIRCYNYTFKLARLPNLFLLFSWSFFPLLLTTAPPIRSRSSSNTYISLHPLPTSSHRAKRLPLGLHPHLPPAILHCLSLRPAPWAWLCRCFPWLYAPPLCRPWSAPRSLSDPGGFYQFL